MGCELAPFAYCLIYWELNLVQHLWICWLFKIKKRVSWPGSFKQILSELCQDCSNLVPWALVCLHATLTSIVTRWTSAVVTRFSEARELMAFGKVWHWSGLFICLISTRNWQLGHIQQGAPDTVWETQSMFQFNLHTASVAFHWLLTLI